MTDRLADDVEELELAAELGLRRLDQLSGMVPADVRRALFPHEIAARTNFAAIQSEVDSAGADLLGRLIVDRRRFLALLEADLRNAGADSTEVVAAATVADRLLAVDGPDGLGSIEGARALLDDAERSHLERLTRAAVDGGVRAQDEAAAQGVPIGGAPVDLSVIDADRQLAVTARRLAGAPHADLVRALRDTSASMSVVDLDATAFVDGLMRAARELSTAPLDTTARNAAQAADGLGRQAAADRLPSPAAVYASELLDENTCGPCSMVDGTDYPDLETAQKDYPAGIYRLCEGGARCRGTLVFVWGSETRPTV